MKRLVDVIGSFTGLVLAAPVLLVAMALVWLHDRHNPFFVAPRVGRNGRTFPMLKLRSMVWNAHEFGWDSTKVDDPRVTPVGHIIRRFKLDELPQLWNVLIGDMSFVGPRPNVRGETDLYCPAERRLFEVRPGITDFSSIVFADLAQILAGEPDPNVAYRRLVRPGKSRLGLFYIDHRSGYVDFEIVLLTLVSFVSRSRALRGVQDVLRRLGASHELIALAGREESLPGVPPVEADATASVSRNGMLETSIKRA